MATAIHGPQMTIGSVLSRAFGAVGAAPVAMFGSAFVLTALPYAGLMAVFRTPYRPMIPGSNPFSVDWPILLAVTLGWWLLYLLAKAVLIRLAAAQLDGEPASLDDHLTAAARALLPLVGLSIIVSIGLMVGFLLLIAPGIILYLMWSVTTPTLVAERQGVFATLARSAALTRGARWRILGLSLVVWVIYFIAAGILGVVAVMARNVSPGAMTIVQTVSSVLLSTVFVAIWTAIQTALYIELRDGKDGPASDRLANIFA